ncbi:MAG: RluA family pseudouridine synthase [Candidatus Sumerlaeia bacterium]
MNGAPPQLQSISFRADRHEAGRRLDQTLSRRYPEWSRAAFQRLIRLGEIRVNGRVVKQNYLLSEGDQVAGSIPPATPAAPAPEPIPLETVYCDEDLIVINKPAGLVVHPAAGNPGGTLVNALLHHFSFLSGVGGVQRPGIVHRLDKGTSGLMLVARNDAAHVRLQRMIQTREIKRRYLALVQGHIARLEGRINAPLGRHPRSREKMTVVEPHLGREAVTDYRRLAVGGGLTLIEASLHTGRTHQIRVHFAHLGFPVVGDRLYGYNSSQALARARKEGPAQLHGALQGLARQMLHAWRLDFSHPSTGAPLHFSALPPADFLTVVSVMGWEGVLRDELSAGPGADPGR